MAKYRERPQLVDASPWFENGDHPKDGKERFTSGEFEGMLLEGKVVRYFRLPGSGDATCENCHRLMHHHGWIDSGGQGQTVCPGDYIVTQPDGSYRAMHPPAFTAAYVKDHEHG